MQHTNISFVNNIAVRDGAAIYAYDISVCNFTADMCPDDDLTQYNHSIFAESPPFLFKWVWLVHREKEVGKREVEGGKQGKGEIGVVIVWK